MRKYETFFIVDPDIPDEATAVVDNKFKTIVTSNGGEVLIYSPWGKRKLAYPIKKRSRGLYILMEYSGEPTLVAELERNLRLDERILKFITVKLEDRFDPEKERERAAAAAAAAVPAFTEDEDAEKPAGDAEADEGEEEDAPGASDEEVSEDEADAEEEEEEK